MINVVQNSVRKSLSHLTLELAASPPPTLQRQRNEILKHATSHTMSAPTA